MKNPTNNNFEVRIIEGTREQKAKRIKEAIGKHCENSSKQVEELSKTSPKIKNILKTMDIKLTEDQVNNENAQIICNPDMIFCLKFVGCVFGTCFVLLAFGKSWEYFVK